MFPKGTAIKYYFIFLEFHWIIVFNCMVQIFSVLQDLNVIENLWAYLKHHIRKYVKPKNKEELVNGIGDFWSKLTVETALCSAYPQSSSCSCFKSGRAYKILNILIRVLTLSLLIFLGL